MIAATRLSRSLILLTVLLVSAQICLTVINLSLNNVTGTMIHARLASELLSPVVIWPIAKFIVAQLLLYAVYVWVVNFVALSVAELLSLTSKATYYTGLTLFVTGCAAILATNAIRFPESLFATPFVKTPWLAALTDEIATVCGFVFLFAFVLAIINSYIYRRRLLQATVLLIIVLVTAGTEYHEQNYKPKGIVVNNSRLPNIVIIGLDSFRPDYKQVFKQHGVRTPHVDNYLQKALIFKEAYTPLARTFPSWMSILTGKYPIHHRARLNLIDAATVDQSFTLAKELQAMGYETIYASDDKRFSNITNDYGFDQIVGPPMGVNDFLLGEVNDFPMSNLVLNTVWGRQLFPYQYGNRAAYITYKPASFMTMLRDSFDKRKGKPLFLAIHLCLSHWPYTWPTTDLTLGRANLFNKYQAGVEGVDQQFGDVMQLLAATGLLNKTLVIVLSDHGTALGMPGDRLLDKQNYRGDLGKMNLVPAFKLATNDDERQKRGYVFNTAYGQATDVMSLKQYQVLIAMRGYGLHVPSNVIHQRVSLIDITPTVLAYLQMPNKHLDGVSLLPTFKNKMLAKRPLYFETGVSAAAMYSDELQKYKVFNDAVDHYRIDKKTGLLYINESMQAQILSAKQRAVLLNDWIYARYPQQTKPLTVVSNVKTGLWTVDNVARLLGSRAGRKYEQLLVKFYGKELT